MFMSDLLFVQSGLFFDWAIAKFVLLLGFTSALGFLACSGGHFVASFLDDVTFAVAVLGRGRPGAGRRGCGRRGGARVRTDCWLVPHSHDLLQANWFLREWWKCFIVPEKERVTQHDRLEKWDISS